MACHVCIVIIVAGNLIFFCLLAFQCNPIESIWNKFIVGQCLDVVGITYATGAFAVALDMILVVLPISEVRRLKISTRERVMLVMLFAFAALSSVASIIRLKFVVQFNTTFDPTCEWRPKGGDLCPCPHPLTRSARGQCGYRGMVVGRNHVYDILQHPADASAVVEPAHLQSHKHQPVNR